jgi:hypothetical protein
VISKISLTCKPVIYIIGKVVFRSSVAMIAHLSQTAPPVRHKSTHVVVRFILRGLPWFVSNSFASAVD